MIIKGRRFYIAMLIYTLGVVVVASASYWLERQRYMEDIDHRLFAAASNIPSILPSDFHDVAHNSGAISVEQDKHNLELMSQHARSGDLTYLYSYVMEDEKIFFTSCNYTQEDVKNDRVVTYWTSYPEGAKEYFEAMTATKPVYVTAGDRWGLFRTILIPMKSPGGLPYVAAADMDITVIQQSLLNRVIAVVGISVIMLLLAIPLVIAYRRTYSEMNAELVSLNEQLQEDIDQAAKLEAELLEATQTANLASQTKSQFLANMSHELRTPLNGVLGMSELLLDTELTEDQRSYAELSRQSADVLLDTVNQILDLASIEAGGMSLKQEKVDTLGFFSDISQLFAPQLAEKQLDLVMNLDATIPAEFEIDLVRLRQVLINLIGNAIKYTEQGGVTVSLRWENNILSGYIEDSGPGIPENAMGRIFETFQQVDNSSSRSHSGTGLGLPIARQICRAMQGDLVLERSGEEGAVFSFNVIALTDSQSVIEQPKIPITVNVVVISESFYLRDWFLSEFGAANAICHLASNLTEALDFLKDANLVFVDTKLELDILNRLSSTLDYSFQRLVWLAWSGQTPPENLRNKMEVVYKPLTRRRLVGLCHAQLAQTNTNQAQAKLSGRLLLVDDNPTNLKAMNDLLIHIGLDVDQATDGFEALHLCSENKYDLVLMDVQMPGMDGLEATRRIRNELGDQAPVIIGVSAHVMEEHIVSAMEAGMTDYLCKPVSKTSLQLKLSEFLS